MWMWRRPNLPVEKAFRSIAYVQSESPFVIIADDIKQDNTVRRYESYMQLPFDLDQMTVNGNDAILWATGDDSRLLVRVLSANAANNSTISFQNEAYTTSISPMDARRLIIGVDAIDPQLKVMLLPHRNGDALPQTSWNNDMTLLTVGDIELEVDHSNGYALFSKNCDNLVGTDCDDGNPCTMNDKIIENCQCKGSEELEILVAEDARVRAGGYSDTNFGTENYLRTKFSGNNSDLTREAFLKFDFNTVDDNSYNKAYLSLYVMQDAGGDSEQELHFVVDDSWSETGITWNNKPTQTQLISTFNDIIPNERIYIDVTNIVNQEFNNDKIISFNIAERILGGHIIYRSKENSIDLQPKLVFSYDYLDDDNDTVCNALDSCPDADDNSLISVQLQVWLEGAYDTNTNQMTTNLQSRGLLPGQTPASLLATPTPAGQPYHITPWNYTGTEGANWTDLDYTGNETDWILVSFRTSTAKNTEVARTAGLIMQDGLIEMVNRCVLPSSISYPLYIVLEHRNHIGIMTPQPIDIINGVLSYDFRASDSYRDPTSFGQKQLPNGEWAMFAGDADQMDFPSFDVNGTDKTEWFDNNGVFDYYLSPDFNLNGDINGQDKTLWFENNGISSRVPK